MLGNLERTAKAVRVFCLYLFLAISGALIVDGWMPDFCLYGRAALGQIQHLPLDIKSRYILGE